MKVLRRPPRRLTRTLLLAGLVLTVSGAWIPVKAWVAHQLIAVAWQRGLASGEPPGRPWPWLDTRPVARLRVPGLDQSRVVLAGDSGQALAFAPGYRRSSAAPGQPGTALISGHRDTHFRFMADLERGDELQLTDPQGRTFRYRISELKVVSAAAELTSDPRHRRLVLATCWPLHGLDPGTDKRYLAIARYLGPLSQSSSSLTASQ